MFDCIPHKFWGWVLSLRAHLGPLHLIPYEILQAMISYSTGEPQETLDAIVSAMPEVTMLRYALLVETHCNEG